MAQLSRIREDHQARLRRDLEVFRQQRLNNRMKNGGRPEE